MKRLILFTLVSLIALSSLLVVPQAQPAAAAVEFDQEFLIDDDLFTDTESMTVEEIQTWLETEGGGLLANWVDDVTMRRPSDNCIVHHPTGMTAAEVIYEAANGWNAQVYNGSGCAIEGAYWGDPGYSNYTMQTISPKALLTILQKEQSLISASGTYSKTSTSYKNPPCCTDTEYKLAFAMGYGVPDSGSINQKFLGFYNQINWAAWQLRFNFERSAGNTDWDGVGYITYSGPFTEGNFKACSSCLRTYYDGYREIDGKQIYMSNRATAALYYYTPHTYPGYFGNYNFVQFYSDWFGSIRSYKAELYDTDTMQTVFTGRRALTWMDFKNTGTSNWYDSVSIASAPSGTDSTRLVTTKPYMRPSKFGEFWGAGKDVLADEFARVLGSDGKTLAANQHVVKPGQIVRFTFMIGTTDSTLPTGVYTEPVRLANSDDYTLNPTVDLKIKLLKPDFEAAIHKKPSSLTIEHNGTRKFSSISFKNTGNVGWFEAGSAGIPYGAQTVRLVTTKPLLASSEFGDYWGVGRNQLNDNFALVYNSDGKTKASDQNVVKPGQILKVNFLISANNEVPGPGNYSEWVRLVTDTDTPINSATALNLEVN